MIMLHSIIRAQNWHIGVPYSRLSGDIWLNWYLIRNNCFKEKYIIALLHRWSGEQNEPACTIKDMKNEQKQAPY